jgi:hypothetical protein
MILARAIRQSPVDSRTGAEPFALDHNPQYLLGVLKGLGLIDALALAKHPLSACRRLNIPNKAPTRL